MVEHLLVGCKKSPHYRGLFLAAIFETRMSSFVAMFMIIVAILFCNWSQFDFSCHGVIISYSFKI